MDGLALLLAATAVVTPLLGVVVSYYTPRHPRTLLKADIDIAKALRDLEHPTAPKAMERVTKAVHEVYTVGPRLERVRILVVVSIANLILGLWTVVRTAKALGILDTSRASHKDGVPTLIVGILAVLAYTYWLRLLAIEWRALAFSTPGSKLPEPHELLPWRKQATLPPAVPVPVPVEGVEASARKVETL